MPQTNSQVGDLATKTASFSALNGEKIIEEIEKQTLLLQLWLTYLTRFHLTGVADTLLFATQSLIRESAATLSMGLVRSAIFSLRGQIDLSLAWLYFKDHPIEWNAVNQTGDGFKLKKDIIDYLGAHTQGFSSRMGILKQTKKRSEPEPYRLLSAHIHGQSLAVLPSIPVLSDVVYSMDQCIECTKISYEVSEYINDILLSVYRQNWHSLPKEIQSALDSRFHSPQQKSEFFK